MKSALLDLKEKKRWIFVLLGFFIFLSVFLLPLPLPRQAQTVLAITALAMVLWISEVIPLYITALLAAFLLILVGKFSPDVVFAQFFDRVVVLVLGGFVLAIAMSKHKLDEFLAYKILGRFGKSSRLVLLGMISVTAFLSMWMSNSAAAALAMPIALFILKKHRLRPYFSPYSKAMILAVAYGATIGGIGTLIGSTPNILTQKFLTEQEISFGFVDWGIRGFPFMIGLVLLCWFVLKTLFPPEIKTIRMKKHIHLFTPSQKKVGFIFLLTIFLWITESVHGIHSSVIALVPIILLYLFDLINTDDFQAIGWSSLILIGGGIALGMAIDISGLDDSFSSFLGSWLFERPLFIIFLLLGLLGVGLTSFLSNTAASAVLIPIITSLSSSLHLDMTNLVVGAAIGVSMDFILPMGTPPSTLAYSTGYIPMRDMILAGVVLSLTGIIFLALLASLWNFF